MALNVKDRNGRHLGFVCNTFLDYDDILMVSLTEKVLDKNIFDMEDIEEYLSICFGCRTIFGKFHKEKFDAYIKSLLLGEYNKISYMDRNTFLRFLLIKHPKKLMELIHFDEKEDGVYGYLLLDINSIAIQGEDIILDEVLDYIDGENPLKAVPLFSKVIHYPTIFLDKESIGQGILFSKDMSKNFNNDNNIGGTKLKLISGNFKYDLEIPLKINIKKGNSIKLYLKENTLKCIFSDGIIYRF